MARKHHDHEDAEQEVELKLLQRARATIRNPERYRRSAVRRALYDQNRRESRRRRAEAAYAQARATAAPDPAVQSDARETSALVREGVATLPSAQRNAYSAVFLNELPPREARLHLGVSPSALNSALYHGRPRLRHMLAPLAQGCAVKAEGESDV